VVSFPDASWLPVLVLPEGQATHMLCTTFSLGPQYVASHVVSGPEASWLPVLVFPGGQGVQVLFMTFSLGPQ
jgi:hypothetical protein